MKLPIKKKYFDLIRSGKKSIEYRDAHITFVCEKTGRTLRKEIDAVNLIYAKDLYDYATLKKEKVIEDDVLIRFVLKE